MNGPDEKTPEKLKTTASPKEIISKVNELIELVINLKVGLFLAFSMLEDIASTRYAISVGDEPPETPKKKAN